MALERTIGTAAFAASVWRTVVRLLCKRISIWVGVGRRVLTDRSQSHVRQFTTGGHRVDHPLTTDSEHTMNNARRITTLVAAGALTLAIGTTAVPNAANAAPTTTERTRDLVGEKARCTAAIDVRLTTLTRLNGSLAAAKSITAGHKSTQAASNTAAASGLGALKTKIAADTDPATLGTDCRSIVEGYRVFALRAPQTHLVIAGDTEASAVAKLNDVVSRLSDAIDKAGAAGKDVTAAQAALTDLTAKLADAAAKTNGVADSVIGFAPADYNADHTLLDGARANVRTTAADLKAARADIKTITTTLKG